jgi:hypothetical protein
MDKEIRDLNEFEQGFFFREVNDHWIQTAETPSRLQWYLQLLVASVTSQLLVGTRYLKIL